MTLVRDVIADARRQFMTTQKDRFNVLAGTITSSATTLTVTYDPAASNTTTPTAVVPGQPIEIDIESMLVVGVTGTTLTVIRGHLGTTKTAHTAGALIRVDPILRDGDLFTAANHELRDLSSPLNGLFRVDTYNFTPTGTTGYDLPLPLRGETSILGVVSVHWQEPQGYWPAVKGWRFERAADVTEFGSGYSLALLEDLPAGRLTRVRYKAGFAPVESLSDDLESVSGLHMEAVDIVAMGAALRAADPREIGRNFHERQGDPRRATEVGAGAQLQAPAALRKKYAERKSAERARLYKMWGV